MRRPLLDLFRRSVFAAAFASSALLAQSPLSVRKPTPSKAHSPTPSATPDQKLAALTAMQRQAVKLGDPIQIANSTRPLSALLLSELAKLRLVQGKGAEASKLYRASLDFEDSPDIRLELASGLLRAGEPQEAVRETARIVEAEPGSASAWAVRGSALRTVGDEGAAVEALTRSLELRPDVNVAYSLASALLARREKDKADRILQQIIAGSNNAPIWHLAVGDAYREARYLTEAVDEFKKAIALDPHLRHAEFFLGLTYLQLNEWGPNSQSFEHLRAAVRLAPRDYVSNFYLGALESTDGSDMASSDRHLHVASEVNPTSPEVWLYLGLNAAREKNTANAKMYLRKAIDLTGPNDDRNNYQIRRVYAVLGRILISEGNRQEGDALLARYKRTEQQSLGNSADVIAQSAKTDLANSAISGAAAAKASLPGMSSALPLGGLETASNFQPAAPEMKRSPREAHQLADTERQLSALLSSSLNDLGTAEARQGQYELALGHFQQAERWQTPTPVLLRNLGTAAFRTGNFQESARALDLYLKSEGNAANSPRQDARTHVMLAMSHFSMGNFAAADKAFAAVPDVTLQDSRAAYSWAYSLAHTGQQQHANQMADGLARQELSPDVMSLVCHLYMDTENYERSIPCYRKAYQADPNLRLARYQVAESLIRLDRPAEAVPELRQELALNPDDPDVQYLLAFALLQISQKDEAVTILQNLIAAHPTHAQAQYQLGKVLLEQGATLEALKHLEAAEQNDPAPDYIHYQLQAAYRKAGRTEEADRELRVYRDIKSHSRQITPPH